MKPNGKSQTTGNTSQNLLFGNNSGKNCTFFSGSLEYAAFPKVGEKSLKLSILLIRTFTVIRHEDSEGNVL